MQVVLVSKATGIAQFVQVADNPNLRSELHQDLLSAAIPLGVLSWQRNEGGLGASEFVFSWVKQDKVAAHVFDLICQEATEKVEEQFKRRALDQAANTSIARRPRITCALLEHLAA
jgi:hypothetical protein